ncbi:Uncharacterised protein [uncultured Blautia sp.]|nr:Uncharacterised protein [uncultured Blautia sp.]
MLTAFHHVQGVDGGYAGGGIQVHGSQDPAVILVLAQLGGGAETNGGIGLAGGADSLGNLVRSGGEDRLILTQALQELVAGVGAALREHQLLAIQFLIGGSQLIRGITHAEAGNPGAPAHIVQGILHQDLALPLGLGHLPDVGDRGTVRISLSIVEQLGQLNVQRGLRLCQAGINMGEDVGRLIYVKNLVLHILIVQGAVLILDMDHIRHILAGLVLTGDLVQQVVGRDIKGRAGDFGVLVHEGLRHLGAAGGDGVQSDLAALGDGLLIELLIRLVRGGDVGGFLPGGGAGILRLIIRAAAAGHSKQHNSSQQGAQ